MTESNEVMTIENASEEKFKVGKNWKEEIHGKHLLGGECRSK